MATEGIATDECENEVPMPIPYIEVTAGANSDFTDANGDFSITYPGIDPINVTATLGGVWFDLIDHAGPVETVSVLVTPPAQTSAKSIRANHDASTEKRFAQLSRQWVEETAGRSTIREKASHPSYQAIIGMGSLAIPHILRALSESPNHWFWALHMITGEDPVPMEDRGDLERMSKAWIQWGRAHNLI